MLLLTHKGVLMNLSDLGSFLETAIDIPTKKIKIGDKVMIFFQVAGEVYYFKIAN